MGGERHSECVPNPLNGGRIPSAVRAKRKRPARGRALFSNRGWVLLYLQYGPSFNWMASDPRIFVPFDTGKDRVLLGRPPVTVSGGRSPRPLPVGILVRSSRLTIGPRITYTFA